MSLDDDPASKLPGIDPSKLEITETITPKAVLPNEDLIFGRTFTGGQWKPELINIHADSFCKTTCSPSNGQRPPAGSHLE
jgi:hypothetical protein